MIPPSEELAAYPRQAARRSAGLLVPRALVVSYRKETATTTKAVSTSSLFLFPLRLALLFPSVFSS